jgi:hypothetical protein
MTYACKEVMMAYLRAFIAGMVLPATILPLERNAPLETDTQDSG